MPAAFSLARSLIAASNSFSDGIVMRTKGQPAANRPLASKKAASSLLAAWANMDWIKGGCSPPMQSLPIRTTLVGWRWYWVG